MALLEQAHPRSKAARFNEIVNLLIEHDAWGLLRVMIAARNGRVTAESQQAPARARKILESLGPSFIKIGQLLATRPDLVPRAYVEEFKNLYDKTTPSPFSEVKQVVEQELGRPLSAVFSSFDEQALASASVGQVHKAKLADGTVVAVKVQHVGIEQAMLTDFEILRGLVTFIEKTFSASRIWQPSEHLNELQNMLERELDYSFEAKHAKKVAANFRSDPSVHIPHVFAELSTKRVLVMEFVDGIRFKHADSPALAGIDKRNVARIVTHAMARQIFVHRIFHADPSPGNLMIMGSDKVAFLDFGAVGIVTERRAKAILRLITSIAKKDADATAEAVLDLCDQHGEYDPKRFANDVERLLDFFEREHVSVADPRMMEMLLQIATEHRMLLPPDFMLITRALFQFDGFCRELDPDYELVSVLEPLVAELVWKTVTSPKKQRELVEETLGELLKFSRTFPQTLNRVVRRVERNELMMRVEVAGLEGIKQAHGRGTLKLGFTIVVAALIIGLAIVYAGGGAAAPVGEFLFAGAAVVIVWALVLVLWSEAMKGRHD